MEDTRYLFNCNLYEKYFIHYSYTVYFCFRHSTFREMTLNDINDFNGVVKLLGKYEGDQYLSKSFFFIKLMSVFRIAYFHFFFPANTVAYVDALFLNLIMSIVIITLLTINTIVVNIFHVESHDLRPLFEFVYTEIEK